VSDEFAKWNELSHLWHAASSVVSIAEVEATARRQRRQMIALATAEAGALVLAFGAALFIAMQTALISMTGITVVFFAVCAYLQHRMRKEPPPSGGDDLLTSLNSSIACEDWNLAQLGVGRAVTLLTLFAMVLVSSDHLRYYATTPAPRLWALLAITAIVLAILAWNLWLTQRARRRRSGLTSYSSRLRGGLD